MDGPPHGRGQQCIEWSDDNMSPPPPGGGYKKGGRIKKKNKGGLLRGPKHERGGIPARLQGGGEVELEGGEYIVNAQTVNAVGTQFLDQLNSTATTYHQGGYSQGQLPSPSNYKRGGKVMPKRKRMVRGGKARKRMRAGGHIHDHEHQFFANKASHMHYEEDGGNTATYFHPGAHSGDPGPTGLGLTSLTE